MFSMLRCVVFSRYCSASGIVPARSKGAVLRRMWASLSCLEGGPTNEDICGGDLCLHTGRTQIILIHGDGQRELRIPLGRFPLARLSDVSEKENEERERERYRLARHNADLPGFLTFFTLNFAPWRKYDIESIGCET